MYIHDLLCSLEGEWKSVQTKENARQIREQIALDLYMYSTPRYRVDDWGRWILDEDGNVVYD